MTARVGGGDAENISRDGIFFDLGGAPPHQRTTAPPHHRTSPPSPPSPPHTPFQTVRTMQSSMICWISNRHRNCLQDPRVSRPRCVDTHDQLEDGGFPSAQFDVLQQEALGLRAPRHNLGPGQQFSTVPRNRCNGFCSTMTAYS